MILAESDLHLRVRSRRHGSSALRTPIRTHSNIQISGTHLFPSKLRQFTFRPQQRSVRGCSIPLWSEHPILLQFIQVHITRLGSIKLSRVNHACSVRANSILPVQNDKGPPQTTLQLQTRYKLSPTTDSLIRALPLGAASQPYTVRPPFLLQAARIPYSARCEW
jgi:hypothetical protein